LLAAALLIIEVRAPHAKACGCTKWGEDKMTYRVSVTVARSIVEFAISAPGLPKNMSPGTPKNRSDRRPSTPRL
jgi:hypothetical protein